MELHRVRRRASAAIVASALCATVLGIAPPRAGAVEDVKSDRVAGQNRFETAAEVAAAAFPNGSDTVVVASGRSFPDALAGAALGVPILLTERDTLPGATAAALDDLEATDAIVLGGTAAVSNTVATEIGEHADVTRVAGQNRYETAAEIGESIGASGVADVNGKATAIIATGLAFADALAGGPIATGGESAGVTPILLVSNEVPAATESALDALGIEQVIILGGTGAVSSDVEADLEEMTGGDAIRLAGTNRYGTAAAIGDWAIENLDFPAETALLASGADFADALAGGPFGGVEQAPMVLTEPVALPAPSKAFLEDHADTIATIHTLGGTAAVSSSAAEAAEKAAETPSATATNETIKVAPKSAVTQANGSTREFTVTGLGTTTVDIALLPCHLVTTSSKGETQFANGNNNTTADGSADDVDSDDAANTAAHISDVNGDTQPPDPTRQADNDDYFDDAEPTNGSVTFTVTGPSGAAASTCVRPVVFDDANSDEALTVPVGNPTIPTTETFGTGGSTTFTPGGAADAPFDVNVDTNPEGSHFFVGCTFTSKTPEIPSSTCGRFNYDDNDTFQVQGVADDTLTLLEFETYLTAGDDVKGTYKPTPSLRSVFFVYADEAPEAPTTNSQAAEPDETSVTISFVEPSRVTIDRYRLYMTAKPADPDECPAYPNTAYTVAATEDDTNTSSTPSTMEITAENLTPNTPYCFHIVSVDDDDPGPPSALVEASTDASADTTVPHLVTATAPGATAETAIAPGDTHDFVFNEAMADSSLTGGSYTIRDADGATATITCGTGGNFCELTNDDKTITIHIGVGALSATPPKYKSLMITAISGFEDLGGTELNNVNQVEDKEINPTA